MPAALLSVAETAALLEIGERAVRKNALAGKYGPLTYEESTRGGGAAGKAIRISLDALPVHYRAKYIEEHGLGEPAAPPPADESGLTSKTSSVEEPPPQPIRVTSRKKK